MYVAFLGPAPLRLQPLLKSHAFLTLGLDRSPLTSCVFLRSFLCRWTLSLLDGLLDGLNLRFAMKSRIPPSAPLPVCASASSLPRRLPHLPLLSVVLISCAFSLRTLHPLRPGPLQSELLRFFEATLPGCEPFPEVAAIFVHFVFDSFVSHLAGKRGGLVHSCSA